MSNILWNAATTRPCTCSCAATGLFIKTTKEFLSLHSHRYSPKYPFLQIKGLFLWSQAPAYYGSTVVGCKQLITLLHHSQQPPVCSGHLEISLDLRPVQPCHLVFLIVGENKLPGLWLCALSAVKPSSTYHC